MAAIMGYSFYGLEYFDSVAPPITNIDYIEMSGMIIDEIEVRTNTDASYMTNIHDQWENDTRLLAKFQGDLEGGNITNNGYKITQFAVKRRSVSEINPYTLAYLPFSVGGTVNYIDYTQPNDTLVYSIVPVGENGLEGRPNEVQVESDFCGYWIIDRDTNSTFAFDSTIGASGLPMVDITLNQGRVEIETMSPYKSTVYTPMEYNSFTLSTVFTSDNDNRSYPIYKNFLDKIVRAHKPMLVKGSNGSLYVCDISKPRVNTPMIASKEIDYFTLQVDCMENMSYQEYLANPKIITN